MGRPRYTTEPYLQRFLEKCCPEPNTGCWIWTGFIGRFGYGSVGYRDSAGVHHNVSAHQVSYWLFVGKVPPGKELHHRCENKWCVNPEHLTPIERREHRRLRMHPVCPFCGRPYDRVTAVGARVCSVCQLARQARWNAAQRSAL